MLGKLRATADTLIAELGHCDERRRQVVREALYATVEGVSAQIEGEVQERVREELGKWRDHATLTRLIDNRRLEEQLRGSTQGLSVAVQGLGADVAELRRSVNALGVEDVVDLTGSDCEPAPSSASRRPVPDIIDLTGETETPSCLREPPPSGPGPLVRGSSGLQFPLEMGAARPRMQTVTGAPTSWA